MRAALVGFLIGILFDVLMWFCGPLTCDLRDTLVFVSTPVAYVVSWITGWEFRQEEAIMIYVVAIPITIPLIGMMAGFLYAILTGFFKRKRSQDH